MTNDPLSLARKCVFAATSGTILATVSLFLVHNWALYGINAAVTIIAALLAAYNYGIARAR